MSGLEDEDARAVAHQVEQRRIHAKRLGHLRRLSAPRQNLLDLVANWAPLAGLRTTAAPGGLQPLLVGQDSGLVLLRGRQGPPGPPGESGAPQPAYVHTQGTPLATWVIPHNLGHWPEVNVFTTGGVEVEDVEVVNVTLNTLEVRFSQPFAGSARLT
jgi:hypothetical protein